MQLYFVHPPELLKCLYPGNLIWDIPQRENEPPAVYITFDDGPHITATPYVLEQLKAYNARATFFCIGKNIRQHPDLYRQILAEGHGTGNHTQTHMNGWKTKTEHYLENIQEAAQLISSKAFRPPYGRIRLKQARALTEAGYRIYMWDVLSADFDTSISPEQCWAHIAEHLKPGSILVFHDSAKAWERMQYALPKTLALCKEKGWAMRALP